jgi:hypothetical protein
LLRHLEEAVRYFDAEIHFHGDPDRKALAAWAKKELAYSPLTSDGDIILALRKAYGIWKARLDRMAENTASPHWGVPRGPRTYFHGLAGQGGGQD